MYYSNYNQSYYFSKRAVAYLKPSPKFPKIRGTVYFFDVPNGAEVWVEVFGLPEYTPATNDRPPIGPHGFHIHEVGICDGSNDEPFESAGGHWAPDGQPHGNHAGDLPVLFSNNGYARMQFFTNRFKVNNIINKSIIIHIHPDDYRTQPTGDAGERIACGIIKRSY
ncbi:superoxide dismutase family protein [Serpentinicella sp. ANB-PHB4]|uniref:superoxide dismutase family protein n=1 Tax=Serpentinicella sp. ANB-PHB4 TaxID=3074076 RepID=UPI002866D576|nr:superoxide dismutase family protein [Serpentinicella sp. ANB-PHB4]MDR5659238.1 superoxide dismutase family protein [Serpentinicella sp. ANB-PHB4]